MELLDILDENGNYTGKVEERKIVHEKGLWHIHVGIWIMNENGELLLQRRSPQKKRNPNKWTRTGGHVESGETPINGIVRETKEEIGVTLPLEKIEFMDIDKCAPDNCNHHFTYSYFIIVNYKIEDYTIQREEVSDLKYITIEELEKIKNNKDVNYTFSQWKNTEFIIKFLKKKREEILQAKKDV